MYGKLQHATVCLRRAGPRNSKKCSKHQVKSFAHTCSNSFLMSQFPGSPLPSFSPEDENTIELCRELFSSLGLGVSHELLATVCISRHFFFLCRAESNSRSSLYAASAFHPIAIFTVLLDDPEADTCLCSARPAPLAGRRCAIGPVHPAFHKCLVN